jgi:hypothetical protein
VQESKEMKLMRTRSDSTRASLIAALLLARLACADGRGATLPHGLVQAMPDDSTPRGLYISKKADAMRVQVLDTSSGAPVLPDQEFKTGDRLSVVIESNFTGYVYVIDIEQSESGEKRFLGYPNPCSRDNELRPKNPLELSAAFDEKSGFEILRVIMSHEPIAELDSAAAGDCSAFKDQNELDARRSALVASLAGSGQAAGQGLKRGLVEVPSTQKQNQAGLRSRDIKLAPGKDKETNNYVAVPLKAGEGRLKEKEFFIFEIRLQHVKAAEPAKSKVRHSLRSTRAR